MGIKGLWGVLAPYSEKKSLHEISGETIAVDLSGWVCDSQNVTEYHIQPKLYLRNLFFRTIYLLLADINPIFVLEGDAPDLKRNVMAARNAIQFRGAAPRSDTGNKKQPDVARRRFKGVLKECESLLKCMGVRCIKGCGEAEATCAQLNAQGLVHAVVSQDSDCFAYGARRVYRNFSVSSASGGGAMQGSVDCYDADKVFSSNGFGRNKMVALALLCGCDYGAGACGSSIGTAVAFLHTVGDGDIIPRLISWVSDPALYEERARWAAAPGRCDRCGHVGRTHLKNGCPVCATHKGCSDLGHKSKVSEVKRELSLRSRALSCGMPFPEPKVMKEFMNTSTEIIDIASLQTNVPSLIQFVKLMSYKLDWPERYCVEKFLPVLTKWHLQDKVLHRTIKPVAIKKKRNPRGVPSFEVVWEDVDSQYDGLIPDDQYDEGEEPSTSWTSIERQDLMRQYYPEIVEKYEESIKKPVKEKKAKGAKKKVTDNQDKPKRKYNKKIKNLVECVNQSLKVSVLNTSKANVSISVKKLKRKIKSNAKKGPQKTIDSFIEKKRRKSSKKSMEILRRSFKNMSVVYNDYFNSNDELFDKKDQENLVKENKHRNLLSMLDNTEGDVDETELSFIIDKMVNRPPVTNIAIVNNKLNKLLFIKNSTPKKNHRKSILTETQNYCSTPKDSPVQKKRFSFNLAAHSINNSLTAKVNTSYFFDKLTDGGDAFEMSVAQNSAVINVECDTTVEYSLPEVCV